MEWFDVPQVIYASASRPEGEAMELYRWWAASAGPADLGHAEETEGDHAPADEMSEDGHDADADQPPASPEMSETGMTTDSHTNTSEMP
jgi:hypothetical protein